MGTAAAGEWREGGTRGAGAWRGRRGAEWFRRAGNKTFWLPTAYAVGYRVPPLPGLRGWRSF